MTIIVTHNGRTWNITDTGYAWIAYDSTTRITSDSLPELLRHI